MEAALMKRSGFLYTTQLLRARALPRQRERIAKYLKTAETSVFEGVRMATLENERTAGARVAAELKQRMGRRRTASLEAMA